MKQLFEGPAEEARETPRLSSISCLIESKEEVLLPPMISHKLRGFVM